MSKPLFLPVTNQRGGDTFYLNISKINSIQTNATGAIVNMEGGSISTREDAQSILDALDKFEFPALKVQQIDPDMDAP